MAKSSISDQLRRHIKDSGLSRYQIAKDAGIANSVLYSFIDGKRTLRLDSVDKIAEVLGLRLVGATTP